MSKKSNFEQPFDIPDNFINQKMWLSHKLQQLNNKHELCILSL